MVQRPRPDLRGGCAAMRIPTATGFSSTDSTTAWAGGSTYKPTISVSFLAKAGSLESLKCRQRCELRPWPFQIETFHPGFICKLSET